MSRIRLIVFVLPLILLACTPKSSNKGTLAQLQDMHVDIKEEENLEGGIDIAMESYQSFLKEAPDSALAPEALRRLADLKIEKEYGVLTDSSDKKGGQAPAAALPAPEHAEKPSAITPVQAETVQPDQGSVPVPGQGESDADFEKRASGSLPVAGTEAGQPAQKTDDLEKAGPLEAITLYQKLLDKYPNYERNDQVLYQMSRAYEEMGQIDKAMEVMDRLVRDFPQSRYIDEVQFRRAEYFFVRRKYLDAEDAYTAIVKIGVSSSFYELALYKLGWTFYKQELYDRALDKFIAVLDYKVSQGYDFERTEDEIERKRLEDTFRVISLSFSYLGGADAVADYFSKHGKRSYEDGI
ncbi:MAG: tetratricopeptide repeat protein, partial [Deltaproteobacteria bacterium]